MHSKYYVISKCRERKIGYLYFVEAARAQAHAQPCAGGPGPRRRRIGTTAPAFHVYT